MLRYIRELLAEARSDRGQALVEYALILSLVALVAVPVLTTVGVSVVDLLTGVANAF